MNNSKFVHIDEGVNDPAIFKAIFLAGGPGAGKSFIVGKTGLTPLGFKVINSDDAFEAALKKAGLEMSPDNIFSPKGQEIRKSTSALTVKKMSLAIKGRLGLVIDGTGANASKVTGQKKTLEALGYECAMVYVSIPLEDSIESDRQRGEDGERTIGPELVTQKFKQLDKSIPKLKKAFGTMFFVIDNTVREKTPAIIRGVLNTITKWSKKMPRNKAAKTWMKNN